MENNQIENLIKNFEENINISINKTNNPQESSLSEIQENLCNDYKKEISSNENININPLSTDILVNSNATGNVSNISFNPSSKILSYNEFPTQEIKEWEQYFFTEKVLIDIVEALEYEENILCLCTPAVADAFWRIKQKKIMCLDIDKRFEYLPGFVYFDLLKPHKINFKPDVIIIDPPFFKVNLLDLYNTIDFLTDKDKSTKLIFAFVKREQKFLLYNFESYNLQLTKYKLEYRSVDATKWDNYGIYANYEFKKMKFVDKKSNKEKPANKQLTSKIKANPNSNSNINSSVFSLKNKNRK